MVGGPARLHIVSRSGTENREPLDWLSARLSKFIVILIGTLL